MYLSTTGFRQKRRTSPGTEGTVPKCPQSMKAVPGLPFRLLKAEDGSHLVAETVFETKQDFINWTQSEHFRKAHGAPGGRGPSRRSAYEVLIP